MYPTSLTQAVPRRTTLDFRELLWSAMVVLLGVASAFDVQLVGRLYYTEVFLLLALPFLLVRQQPHPGTEKFHKAVLIFGVLWLWGQGLTDVIRATPFEDWSRGIAKITFLLLNYIALRRLLNTDKKVLLFTTGAAIGLAISVQRLEFDAETTWKFGLGAMYAILLMIACGLKPFRKFGLLPVILLVGVAGLSAMNGSRSLVGTVMIAAGILLLGRILRSVGSYSIRARAIGFLLIGVFGFGTYSVMGYLSSEGILGQEVQKKYRDQIKRGGGNLLLGGRSESRISLIAIRDSPIIGHGSWAKNIEYRRMYEAMLARAEGKPLVLSDNRLIPGHSYFFSGWVEAGILGAVWWAFVLFIVLYSIGRLLTWTFPLGPLATLVAAQNLWDIPFSPFGANVRISVAFALVLLPMAASEATRLVKKTDTQGREVLVDE